MVDNSSWQAFSVKLTPSYIKLHSEEKDTQLKVEFPIFYLTCYIKEPLHDLDIVKTFKLNFIDIRHKVLIVSSLIFQGCVIVLFPSQIAIDPLLPNNKNIYRFLRLKYTQQAVFLPFNLFYRLGLEKQNSTKDIFENSFPKF